MVDVSTMGDRPASKVSGLGLETPPTPLNLGYSATGQAGKIQTAQIPTRQQQVSYLTVDYPALKGSNEVYKWYDKANKEGTGMIDVTVHLLDAKNEPATTTHYYDCYPYKYSTSESSPAGAEYYTETIEITYTRMEQE